MLKMHLICSRELLCTKQNDCGRWVCPGFCSHTLYLLFPPARQKLLQKFDDIHFRSNKWQCISCRYSMPLYSHRQLRCGQRCIRDEEMWCSQHTKLPTNDLRLCRQTPSAHAIHVYAHCTCEQNASCMFKTPASVVLHKWTTYSNHV